jgi:hypothetical protein
MSDESGQGLVEYSRLDRIRRDKRDDHPGQRTEQRILGCRFGTRSLRHLTRNVQGSIVYACCRASQLGGN